MSLQRVKFAVFEAVKSSASGDSAHVHENTNARFIDLSSPAEGISYDWIVQSLQAAFPQHQVQIVELKYEDDEHDLITFSSQHEVLEAITVAEATEQSVFKVFATILKEEKTKSENEENPAEEKDASQERFAGFASLFAETQAYFNSLGESAKDAIANAVQIGIQELREFGDPKQALLDTLNMLPESPSADLNKIIAEVQRVSAEQWEHVKAFIRRIPEQTWAFIEVSVPQLVNFLGRQSGAASAAAASFFANAAGDTGGNPLANLGPFMGLMSMMNPRSAADSDAKVDVPRGLNVEIESADELIPLAEPGMHVVRTWKIRNTGSVRLPAGVQLRAVIDPDKIASNITPAVNLPELSPGETAEVSQLIQAPQAHGIYNVVYALKTMYGQGPRIGPELPVELLVTEAY